MSTTNMSIFFTGDTHFNHGKIIVYCNRPFDGVTHMNETLVANWNAVVKKEDHVYHLGDFGFGAISTTLDRLNGRIHMVIGSHDKQIWDYKSRFVEIGRILEFEEFTLCHYAMRVWPRSHYNTCHLFGHSHGKLEGQGKSFDIGVDSWGFTPVSLARVREEMAKRPDNFNLVKPRVETGDEAKT